ncbi:molybdopterin dinucleotide binding domain-containing protein, partial [Chloroflexota bacterium]
VTPWLGAPYYLYMNKAVDSMYECKTDREICAGLALRLGVNELTDDRTDEEWLRVISEGTGDIPSFEDFKEKGAVKIEEDPPFVAFREQIDDPINNPFPTLSGKIEIYCDHLAEMNNPLIPPIAKYIPTPEGYDDPITQKYPLQLITSHWKRATHSTLEKIPWLEELESRRVWMNTLDAQKRGISDGEAVLVFNDRGRVFMRARVTERIMPGVVDMAEGGWFDIDQHGVDRGGCANMLTTSNNSPAGAWATNTGLVEVERA